MFYTGTGAGIDHELLQRHRLVYQPMHFAFYKLLIDIILVGSSLLPNIEIVRLFIRTLMKFGYLHEFENSWYIYFQINYLLWLSGQRLPEIL